MRILYAKVKFSVGHGKFNFPSLYAEIASSGRIPVTQVHDFCHAIQRNFGHPEVPRFEMQFIKHGGFQWHSLFTCFKTRRINLSGNDWQMEKQGHWNRHSGYVFNLSQEASKVKKLIELIRDKEDRAEVN